MSFYRFRVRLGWLIAAAIATVLMTSACERRDRDVSAVLAADSVNAGPSQTSWSVNFDLQKEGKRRARFIADKMEHYDTDDSSYVRLTMLSDSAMRAALPDMDDSNGSRSVKPGDTLATKPRTFAGFALPEDRVIAYVFEEGDSSAVITAIRMLFFADEGRFEAFGDVEVVTTEGKQLYSEQLTWDQTNRKIRTRRFVRIVTPSEEVQGNGLLADEDLDTYQIGRFTANVDIENDDIEDDDTEDGDASTSDTSTRSDTVRSDTTGRR